MSFFDEMNKGYQGPVKKKVKRGVNKKVSEDNRLNQKISAFIPITDNISETKQRDVLYQIHKLIANLKFNSLIYLFEYKKKILEDLNHEIASECLAVEETSNKIDMKLINGLKVEEGVYKISKGKTINFSENLCFFHLFEYYYKYLKDFNTIIKKNSIKHNNPFLDEKNVFNSIRDLEQLLKFSIKNCTLSDDFCKIFGKIFYEYIESFLEYLSTNDSEEVFSENLLLRVNLLLDLLYICFQKDSPNKLFEKVKWFIKIFSVFLLMKIYSISEGTLQKKNNKDVVYNLCLFYQLSKKYFLLFESDKDKDIYQIIEIVFNEFFYNNLPLNFEQYSFCYSKVLDGLKKYFCFDETYLFENRSLEGMKSSCKLYFLMWIFQFENSNKWTVEIKNILSSPILFSCFNRYYLIFFLFFFELGKSNIYFLNNYENFLKKCSNSSSKETYFDSEIISNIINVESHNKIVKEKELLEKYLLSDSIFFKHLINNWIVEEKTRLSIIFSHFSIINNNSRKTKLIDSNIIKLELENNLKMLLEAKEPLNKETIKNSIIIEYIQVINKCIQLTLKNFIQDEKGKIKLFSHFLCLTNPIKKITIKKEGSGYSISIISFLCVTLGYIEFAKNFIEKRAIESCLSKLTEILENEAIKEYFSSFIMSIWFYLIKIILNNKIDIEIKKYITIIDQSLSNSMITYQRFLLIPNSQERLEETEKVITKYLKFLKEFQDNNSRVIFEILLFETSIKNIIDIESSYPNNLRIDLLQILEKLIEEIYSKKLDINNNQSFTLPPEDKTFLIKLKAKYFLHFDKIASFYVSHNNTNILKRINFDLYETVCILQAKSYGLITFYNLNIFNPFDYCNKVLKDSPFFKGLQQGVIPKSELEYHAKLPYKLFQIYLTYNPTLIQTQLSKREYKMTLQYFLMVFFLGAYFKSDKSFLYSHGMFQQYYQMANQSENFCSYFIEKLDSNCLETIENNFLQIKNEIEVNMITERNREESSYYNILKVISILNPKNFNINYLFEELLSKTTVKVNINMIESRFLFYILNNDIVHQGISRLINFINNDEKLEFNAKMAKLKMLVFNKFYVEYAKNSVDQYLKDYLDKFFRTLSVNRILFHEILSNKIFMGQLSEVLISNSQIQSKNNFIKQIIKNFVQYYFDSIKIKEFFNQIDFPTSQIFSNKVEDSMTKELYIVIFENLHLINVIPGDFKYMVFCYLLLNAFINKPFPRMNLKDKIEKVVSLISEEQLIRNFASFMVFKYFLKKISLWLTLLKLIKEFPSQNVMNKLQNLFEEFFYYMLKLYSSNFGHFKIISLINKANVFKKFQREEPSNDSSDNQAFELAISKINENKAKFLHEILDLNSFYQQIFLNYNLGNPAVYERIKKMQYINHIMQKAKK